LVRSVLKGGYPCLFPGYILWDTRKPSKRVLVTTLSASYLKLEMNPLERDEFQTKFSHLTRCDALLERKV
jgi:hypothetical protein